MAAVVTAPADARFDGVFGTSRGSGASATQVRRERAIDNAGDPQDLLADPSYDATAGLAALVEAFPDLSADPDLNLPEELAERMRAHVIEDAIDDIRYSQDALGLTVVDLGIETDMHQYRDELVAVVEAKPEHLLDTLRASAIHQRQESFARLAGARLAAEPASARLERLKALLFEYYHHAAVAVITSDVTPESTFTELARLVHYRTNGTAPSSVEDVVEDIYDDAADLLLGRLNDPGFWALERRA